MAEVPFNQRAWDSSSHERTKSHEESKDSSWDFSVLSRLHIFAHFLHIGGKGVHTLHRLHGAHLEHLLHLVKKTSCKQEPREFAPLLGSHLAHQIGRASCRERV